MKSLLTFVLFIVMVAAATKERLLNGLGLEAPENQALLNCPHDVIRDTNGLTIQEVQELNSEVEPYLSKLITSPYFRTYKVDLSDSRCPWKDEDAVCGNRACAIEPLSDDDIKFKTPQYLGRLRKNSVSKRAPQGSLENCAPDDAPIYFAAQKKSVDRDYCYPEDESSESTGVWVDLTDNIERFTGYAGDHAHNMWAQVYNENCFGYTGSDYNKSSTDSTKTRAEKAADRAFGRRFNVETGSPDADSGIPAKMQLAQVFAHPRDSTATENEKIKTQLDAQCVEQRLFYKLLSGMHASISTHLSYDWLNVTSGAWEPNLDIFVERVGWHPDRINYLFFDYVLMSRAVSKLEKYQQFLSFSPTCNEVDSTVRHALAFLGSLLAKSRQGITESELFATPEGAALKDEFRRRVRNVNALMSCVGCERCRLWGKIQTAGYGTALKILLELPERPEDDMEAVAEVFSDFRRSELVALIQTFGRISHSVAAVTWFRNYAFNTLVDKDSWKYQIKFHIWWTGQALKFIFNSYLEFPKNIGRILLVVLNTWWTRFISAGNSSTISQHVDI